LWQSVAWILQHNPNKVSTSSAKLKLETHLFLIFALFSSVLLMHGLAEFAPFELGKPMKYKKF
jgi:hypothetical protein